MMRELCVQLNQVMLERTVPVSIRFLADSGPYATSGRHVPLQHHFVPVYMHTMLHCTV